MANAPTILLAEDEESDAFLVERALKEAGLEHRLSVVRDGQEALCYLRGEGRFSNREDFPFPVLVLLDLDMPNLNGFDVLAQMRRHPILKDVPVVVFTASSLSPDVSRAYRLGANSFLTKPSQISQLSAALKEAVHFFVNKPCGLDIEAFRLAGPIGPGDSAQLPGSWSDGAAAYPKLPPSDGKPESGTAGAGA